MDDNTLREKMRKRRAAMEMTLMSETGSVQSDYDHNTRPKSRNQGRGESTIVEIIDEEDNTEIQQLRNEETEQDDMLEELKTRRMQRQNELGQGSWTVAATPTNQSTQDLGSSIQTLNSQYPGGDDDDEKQTNLNASIRERLRSKVRGKKQIRTPGPTDEETEDVPERKLRGLRSSARVTRFDEAGVSTLAENEEYRVDENGYSSPTSRRKALGIARPKHRAIPSNEDAYQFFTCSMDIDEDDRTQQTPQPPTEPETEPVEAADDVIEEESFLLDDGQLTFHGKDPYMANAERLNAEAELYFVPSVLSANVSDKIPEGANPRYLEDEGFYVGKPTPISIANLNIMENRILGKVNENGLWFGEDATLKRLPDPLREKSSRPLMLAADELDPQLKTSWAKAEISGFDDRFIDRSGEKWYQIDIDVSTLSFTHHPLFSKEHVLQSRLQEMYSNYCRRKQQALSVHLTEKLTALKMALNQCYEAAEMQLSSSSKAKPIPDDLSKRIRDYGVQVKQTRKQRDTECTTDRKLLKEILECWHDLKQLREEQGYTNTPSKLVIFREVTNKEQDEIDYQEEIQDELQERRNQFEQEFVERMKEYKLQMKEWKKRKKLRKKRATDEEHGEQSELVDDVEDAAPQRPDNFNEEDEYQLIVEKFERTRRKPGEPILTPELQTAANVTAVEQCPRAEQLRRKDVQRWQAFVKIMFNDKEVSRTLTKFLPSDFTIHFGEIHPVKILQWPESIKLQIHESSGLQNKLLTEVFIPIPEASKVSGAQANLDAVEFSSNAEVVYQHDGVGSGLAVSLRPNNESAAASPVQTYLTSGRIFCSSSWGLDHEGKPLVPPQSSATQPTPYENMLKYDALASLGAAGMMDVHTLAQWISESNLDPNDPANADIMSLVKHTTSDSVNGGPKYFRLHQLEDETCFVDKAELKNSKRFRVLQLRNELVPEFRNFKAVPIRDKDIPDNVFQAYERRIDGVDEEDTDDDFGAHRAAVTKFLNKVRQQVIARSLVAKRQRDLRDMVIEDEVPDVGSLGFRIAQLLAPRRPLKPVRRERKTIGAQNLSVTNVRVLVNAVRAFDVPVRVLQPQTSAQALDPRSSARPLEASTGAQSVFTASSAFGGDAPQNRPAGARTNPLGEPMVRPFVEVVFQGNFIRTSVADGPNPSWNEELTLPFRPPNDDYSPANLQTVNDVIYLNIFDEVVVDILQDEQTRATNIHQRLERHWLGSIELPFSTVYFNTKVDGTFKISTPAVLLGYQHNQPRVQGAPDIGIGARDQTFLTLFVTIEPPLQPSQPLAEKFESSEDERLINNAYIWLEELKKKFPKREFKVLATDLNGKKVFLTRYIREQNLPPSFGFDPTNPPPNAMDVASRFVSLIPYISDSVAFPDLCDLWSTSDQFLQMLAGDEEEHAVLLCNYFLWLGKRAWLVIGTGIPEGSTTYVLTCHQGVYHLWNAHTGEKFPVGDAYCPLQNIACLINAENIWANIQHSGQPYRMSFDVSKPKLWKPFFTTKYPNPGLTSVQKPLLNYTRTDPQYVTELQEKIERLLRDKIMEWRPRYVTRWNRYCSQSFRDLLANMEQTYRQRTAQNHKTELDHILSSYKLSGFPLQMAFTDIRPVIDTVHSTGVHLTEDANVEFALAVHIHPYPNNVLSLWVYVGTLTRKIRYY
ncbi:coiled-coil and C2 domain-containing protein 2A-like [Dendronephthya gigantea]|uniref:coiled-coil and C2 domain-containing protein 2A-like n=1 Tax=Dendronephthya gigantea TaxID=151771 RepID=UPI00106A3BF9|nr:coiled-coil and C2 domain-containing protein 2A-like [Dendronephthya gigantea]